MGQCGENVIMVEDITHTTFDDDIVAGQRECGVFQIVKEMDSCCSGQQFQMRNLQLV